MFLQERFVKWLPVLVLVVMAGQAFAGADSFVTVLSPPHIDRQSAFGTTFGYARLTLSEADNLLCYEVSVTGPTGPQLEVLILHGAHALEVARVTHDAAPGRGQSASGADVTGCAGPLTAPQKADLLADGLSMHVLDAISGGEIGGRVVGVRAAPVTPEQAFGAVAELLQLDQRQWDLMTQLIRFSPRQWAQLSGYLKGGASAGANTLTTPAGILPELPISFADLTLAELEAELKQITDLATSVRNALTSNNNSVLKGINLNRSANSASGGTTPSGSTTPSSLSNLGVNRAIEEMDSLILRAQMAVGTISGWVDTMRNSPFVESLAQIAPDLIESIRDDLQLLAFLRDGFEESFDTFAGAQHDCGSGTPCDTFKGDLLQLLADIRMMVTRLPELSGIETDLAIETSLIAMFIDRTPPLPLFVLKNVADESMPRWRSLSEDVAELFMSTSTGGGGLSAVIAADHRSPVDHVCGRIFRRETAWRLAATVVGGVGKLIALVADVTCPVTFLLGATVVAGGTYNPLPNPCWVLTKSIESILGFIENRLNLLLQRCSFDRLRATALFEPSLSECRPLVTLMLPAEEGGFAERLRSHLQFRIDSMSDAGLDRPAARMRLNDFDAAFASGDFRGAFCCLCSSFDELTGSSSACQCP